jgi:hypothetical protein
MPVHANEIETSATSLKIVEPILKTPSLEIESKPNNNLKHQNNIVVSENSDNNSNDGTPLSHNKENTKNDQNSSNDNSVIGSNGSCPVNNNGLNLKSDLITTSSSLRESNALFNLSHALQLFRLFRYVYMARTEQKERYHLHQHSQQEYSQTSQNIEKKRQLFSFLLSFWRNASPSANDVVKLNDGSLSNNRKVEHDWITRLVDFCAHIFETRSESILLILDFKQFVAMILKVINLFVRCQVHGTLCFCRDCVC